MKTEGQEWYKNIWTLDIKNASWVEDTENQVNFIIKTLGLTGKERILDLACGFGRHSLSFAQKGYSVVGVDFTKDFIDDARASAKKMSLSVEFIHSDIRDTSFNNEFDVVLSLADGSIGYYDNDEDNLKTFDKIASALKPGGKYFLDHMNAEYAENCFPYRGWEIGEKALAIVLLEWDKERRRMMEFDWDVPYGLPAIKPVISKDVTIRLYSKAELQTIFDQRQMRIIDTFSNYYGKKDSCYDLQLMVYSQKNK